MTALLTTKFYIPPPGENLVLRQRLMQRLSDSSCILTLLSAPPGFGKTTILSTWLATLPNTPAWVSLDEDDNQPVHFWSYLIGALEKAAGETGRFMDERTLLEAEQAARPQVLLTGLINKIAGVSRPLLLILDDYHHISTQSIHDSVSYLLDHMPANLRMVIATRTDPPLPLGRWRARGQLTEIRAAELRFSADEVRAFLSSMDLHLPPDLLAALEERTEGWAAGLQLAALSLQHRDPESAARFIAGFSGRHHFVLDYLTDEVLHRQPQEIQDFLLQTALLEQISAPLCDTLLADQLAQPAQRMLETLEHANLFLVPLDDEGVWFRYHHLFADLLRARLNEIYPQRVPELHRRAAQWYALHGLYPRAVHHAFAAKDYSLAAGIIENAVRQVSTWSSGDIATLLGWLRILPDDVVLQHPWLRLYSSRALYITGKFEAAGRILEQLEQSLQAAAPRTAEQEHLWAEILAHQSRAAGMRGEIEKSIQCANQALALLPQHAVLARYSASSALGLASFLAGDFPSASRGYAQALEYAIEVRYIFAILAASSELSKVQFYMGEPALAMQTCQRAVQWGTIGGTKIPAVGLVELVLAQLTLERNELELAHAHVLEGLDLLKQGGISDNFGLGRAVLALIQQASGDHPAALATIEEAIRAAESVNMARNTLLAQAFRVQVWLGTGMLEPALRWAEQYSRRSPAEYAREFEDLTLAQVWLAAGKPQQALAVLERLIEPARTGGRLMWVMEGEALRAAALDSLGQSAAALALMRSAVQFAATREYQRVFLRLGEPARRLLSRCQAGLSSAEQAYIKRLLTAFPAGAPAETAAVQPAGLAEALTEREMEVLTLLAEGLSNKEIAERLIFSTNTLKTHLNNLFGKLAVHTRLQAVLRARELGLLPEE